MNEFSKMGVVSIVVSEDSDDHPIWQRSSHDDRIQSFTVIMTMIYDDYDVQMMTAVALDFCAEELELRGGREVGRWKY